MLGPLGLGSCGKEGDKRGGGNISFPEGGGGDVGGDLSLLPGGGAAHNTPLLPPFKVPQLRRGHLEECGHWTQMERYQKTTPPPGAGHSPPSATKIHLQTPICALPARPAALNKILVEWLEGLPPDVAMPRGSRL